jgi:predicted nucleotidyltransferase
MKNLTTELLNEITNRLVQEFNPARIILFGSYAWGNPKDNSDIDLCVILNNSDESIIKRTRRAYHCLSGLGIPKDILVKTHKEIEEFKNVVASLERKILEEGIILYAEKFVC